MEFDFYFLKFKETKKLFYIFEKHKIEAMFVGGCVRDSINGEISEDFDIAVNYDILNLINILKNEKIKCIPTGIKYGSITVLINNKKFELTSLRKDEKCYGRSCDILKINSFEEDAKRRDFTINSIYVSKNGEIFDYLGGINDLKKRDVIFVGDPKKRISEDYLRIFRYYRFCAKYGDFSNRYSEIIKHEIKNIKDLSIERIQNELFKILESPTSLEILKLMNGTGALEKANLNDYAKILTVKIKPELETKIYILFKYEDIFKNFRLQRKSKNIIKNYKKFEKESVLYCSYKNDIAFLNQIILIKNVKFKEQIEFFDKLPIFPEFPLKFSDLPKETKFASRKLKACEKWWVNNNFNKTKQDCLKYIDINQEL